MKLGKKPTIQAPRYEDQPTDAVEPAPLSAEEVIARSGTANWIALLRTRMGFPKESFELAVRPLLDGYATMVQLRRVAGSRLYAGTGGELQRALAAALQALELRRGQILPRNVPPEELGAQAHRWTYAVFVVSLLREDGKAPFVDVLACFERWVPAVVKTWLAGAPDLWNALRAVLGGGMGAQSIIAELLEHAAGRTAPPTASAATTIEHTGEVAPIAPAASKSSLGRKEADPADVLETSAEPNERRARQFMHWLNWAISDGRLAVNGRDSLVHGVDEGVLLVSPQIFRMFNRNEGVDPASLRDESKRLQREVFKCGWHLRAEGGVNLHAYAWAGDGGSAAQTHGMVLLDPERFIDPVPTVNRALLRRTDPSPVNK